MRVMNNNNQFRLYLKNKNLYVLKFNFKNYYIKKYRKIVIYRYIIINIEYNRLEKIRN